MFPGPRPLGTELSFGGVPALRLIDGGGNPTEEGAVGKGERARRPPRSQRTLSRGEGHHEE
jgi:hypothetical protein